MIIDWDVAIKFVLKMEGGYTLDPNDPGGETIFGVARNKNPQWSGWAVVDRFRNAIGFPSILENNEELKAEALAFYNKNFWLPCHCNDLPTALAIATFDCAVNQGPSKARRLLQMALDVEVDGNIGPKTLAAAAAATRYRLKMLLALRLEEYARLMAANPKLLVYAKNWSYRVISLAELIFKEASVI